MSKFSKKIIAVLAVIPMLAFAVPAFADSPGQLQGGANTYVVKNVTKNGSYAATATATSCDVVQYSVELHNTEYGKLSNIVVKATMPSTSTTSHVSNMTATTAAGGTTGTSGSVTVTTSSALTLSYVNGSTKLYDGQGNLVKTLADGITSNGVNVGDLNGSTTEFVNFQGKLNCETPPTCKPGQTGTYPNCVTPTCKEGQTGTYPNCVTPTCKAGQTGTYPNCTTPTPPVTPPTTPPTLPNTGAGNVIGIAVAAIVAGTVAGRVYLSRKLARKA